MVEEAEEIRSTNSRSRNTSMAFVTIVASKDTKPPTATKSTGMKSRITTNRLLTTHSEEVEETPEEEEAAEVVVVEEEEDGSMPMQMLLPK